LKHLRNLTIFEEDDALFEVQAEQFLEVYEEC